MAEDLREVSGSPFRQGQDEQLRYVVSTTNVGSSPSNGTANIYEVLNGAYTNKTSTLMSGTCNISGNNITLPIIRSLTPGQAYRVEVRFTISGNIYEHWFTVIGER